MKITHFALFFIISHGLWADTSLDQTVSEILEQTRLSRIPAVISQLEERSSQKVKTGDYLSAREDLKKAILLKQSIGMKDSEGNAQLLFQMANLETKLGHSCEALHYSSLAKQIVRKVNLRGEISSSTLNRGQTAGKWESCEEVSWLQD
ncbi:hypothetical protein EHQ59_08080 [Leptospira kemamanensis]|uniref:Tetratricopeptide repeat protein n=1 Tax=Leptospira kemamanensis TaxID=2484942 RepID=A0A4R9JSE3_9LEPT|nr:hypothetical protein [Leptospira kemamanensis]TGL54142.1 hypothetical protein EHQ59_08080 [Leptospira kemamanensis]